MPAKKEYDFVVTLKHSNYRLFNIISVILCVLAIAVSVQNLMNLGVFYAPQWLALILIIFIIGFIVFSYFKRNDHNFIITFRWALVAGAVLWFLPPQNNLIIALLYIVASFIERQLKLPQEIGFDREEIRINSFPSRQYQWQEVSNVVLKDNMLTIDFRNNKILQKETESDVSNEIEKEFNAFCTSSIKHSKENIL